jgi:hypothetical protein
MSKSRRWWSTNASHFSIIAAESIPARFVIGERIESGGISAWGALDRASSARAFLGIFSVKSTRVA